MNTDFLSKSNSVGALKGGARHQGGEKWSPSTEIHAGSVAKFKQMFGTSSTTPFDPQQQQQHHNAIKNKGGQQSGEVWNPTKEIDTGRIDSVKAMWGAKAMSTREQLGRSFKAAGPILEAPTEVGADDGGSGSSEGHAMDLPVAVKSEEEGPGEQELYAAAVAIATTLRKEEEEDGGKSKSTASEPINNDEAAQRSSLTEKTMKSDTKIKEPLKIEAMPDANANEIDTVSSSSSSDVSSTGWNDITSTSCSSDWNEPGKDGGESSFALGVSPTSTRDALDNDDDDNDDLTIPIDSLNKSLGDGQPMECISPLENDDGSHETSHYDPKESNASNDPKMDGTEVTDDDDEVSSLCNPTQADVSQKPETDESTDPSLIEPSLDNLGDKDAENGDSSHRDQTETDISDEVPKVMDDSSLGDSSPPHGFEYSHVGDDDIEVSGHHGSADAEDDLGHHDSSDDEHASNDDENEVEDEVEIRVEEDSLPEERYAIWEEIIELVEEVLPDEVENIDELLAQFQGREEKLRDALRGMQARNAALAAQEAEEDGDDEEEVDHYDVEEDSHVNVHESAYEAGRRIEERRMSEKSSASEHLDEAPAVPSTVAVTSEFDSIKAQMREMAAQFQSQQTQMQDMLNLNHTQQEEINHLKSRCESLEDQCSSLKTSLEESNQKLEYQDLMVRSYLDNLGYSGKAGDGEIVLTAEDEKKSG